MSLITFNVEIDPKENKLGLHEIRVRMTQARKHKRFNVGYAIKKSEWNSITQQVTKAHKLHVIINAAVISKKQELEKEYLQSIPTKQPLTIGQLYSKAKSDILGLSFISYFEYHISKMENAGTAMGYETVLNKLKDYLNQKDLYFTEIDYDFVQDYVKHLRDIGNSANTVHNNFKTLRAVFNHAVKSRKFIPSFVSPFYGQDVQRKKVKRKKLDTNEIAAFEKYEAKESTQKFHAHKFFLLCYYLLGVRASSMIKMKWKNIVDGRCIYEPAKGQATQKVKIPSKAQAILDYYRQRYHKAPRPDNYIFPFMKDYDSEGKKLEGRSLVKKIDAINANINNQLADISAELGFDKKVTTHVARHSFAYNSRILSGNDIYAVQKALGHSSVVITEGYFTDADENTDSDKLSNLMFN